MSMTPKELVFEDVWSNNLCDTVRNLMLGTLTRSRWHDGYGDVYDLCVAKPEPLAGRLYKATEEFLRDYVESLYRSVLEKSTQIGLPAAYHECWEEYSTNATYLNHLFLFLNLEYVKKNRTTSPEVYYEPPNDDQLLEVGEMALDLWMKVMIQPIQDGFIQLILKVVDEDRRNLATTDDGRFIKGIVESFVAVQSFRKGEKKLEFYRRFEADYLLQTSRYYSAISSELVGHTTCSEFMEKILFFVDQEVLRCAKYLHASSRGSVIDECERVMVGQHIDFIYQEAKTMVAGMREKDLTNMYTLLKPLDSSSIQPLIDAVQQRIESVGHQSLQDIDPENAPQSFVEAMLTVHQDYNKFVEKVFSKDRDFMAALGRACAAVINSKHPKINVKAPELIARYCDQLLKKGSRSTNESELEDHLSNIIIVFKFLEDKDHFLKSYARLLAKRLLHGLSTSMECEDIMITKLKAACGFEYTSKLHQMLKDMQLSSDLNVQFLDHLNTIDPTLDLGLSVSILQAGAWPMPTTPVSPFIPPSAFEDCVNRFTKFYVGIFKGRKLTWLNNLSNADLRLNFPSNGKSYTITCSIYTTAVALLFENDDSLTFKRIQQHTSLQDDYLVRSLQSLVENKILLEVGATAGASTSSSDSGPNYTAETVFSLNFDFSHKRTKFKIRPIPVKDQVVQEQEQTAASLAEDRKVYLQALVVRIMKSRKILKHNDLIEQVTSQSTDRFRPSVSMIKKTIEYLIAKQYIELMPNSTDEYSYVA